MSALTTNLILAMGTRRCSQSNVNVLVSTPLYVSPEAIAAPEKVWRKQDLQRRRHNRR